MQKQASRIATHLRSETIRATFFEYTNVGSLYHVSLVHTQNRPKRSCNKHDNCKNNTCNERARTNRSISNKFHTNPRLSNIADRQGEVYLQQLRIITVKVQASQQIINMSGIFRFTLAANEVFIDATLLSVTRTSFRVKVSENFLSFCQNEL